MIAAAQAQHAKDIFPVRIRVAVRLIQIVLVTGINVQPHKRISQVVLHTAINQRGGLGHGDDDARGAGVEGGVVLQSHIAVDN